MKDEPAKTLQDLVKHVGRYPDQAFLFIREGLSHASEEIHGCETDAHRVLYAYLAKHELDWSELAARYHRNELSEDIVDAVDAVGGCEKLNRHVSGRELCWGLRSYALKRWGMMARTVLETWNLKSTSDFGRIVFGFIDLNIMQKQAEDRVEDFENVYSFEEAFDEPFRMTSSDDGDEDVDA